MLCQYNHNQQFMEMNIFSPHLSNQSRSMQKYSHNPILFQKFPYIYAFPPFFPPSQFLPFNISTPRVNQFYYPHQPLYPKSQHYGNGSLGEKKISQNITNKQSLIIPRETNKRDKYKKSMKGKRKVRYFDPTVAPPLTSKQYNYVNNIEKDMKATVKLENAIIQDINQQSFPQEDSNPFIIFKHRKMKKKYKKFMNKYESLCENPSSEESSLSQNVQILQRQVSEENNDSSLQNKEKKLQYNHGKLQLSELQKKQYVKTEMEIKVSVNLDENEANKPPNYSNTDYRWTPASNQQ